MSGDSNGNGGVPLPDGVAGSSGGADQQPPEGAANSGNAADGVANAARAVESGAGGVGKKPGTGVAAGAGMVRDVAEGASAASEGRVGEATDAAVRAGVTAAATVFGGTAGGDGARAVMNTGVGDKGVKSVKWIAVIAVFALVAPLVLMAGIFASLFVSFNNLMSESSCVNTSASVPYKGGEGGVWAMKFLHDQGLRGQPLKVMWSIVMRESGGDPTNRTPSSGTYDNGSYDAGLYQTNSENSGALAEYGLTMEDAFDPVKAFNFWMRRASPNNKLMSSLPMWGLYSWDNPTLNTAYYSDWSASQHQEMIVIPFEEKMRMFDDAARQAGVNVGSDAEANVSLPPLGSAPALTLTVAGGKADANVPVADPSKNAGGSGSSQPAPASSYGPGNAAPGDSGLPEDKKTVSGWEVLEPGDARLVTYTVAGRSITTHRDYQQLFTDFLNAWNDDPILGRGRLNIDKGVGPVDSYEMRKARVTKDRWSDHGGYAIDIRYDLLPAFAGYQMTPEEREATKRLLERFPQLGWGGDYDLEYMDEMHFYVAPGSDVQPSTNPCSTFATGFPATGDLQSKALQWALAISGGAYNYDTDTNPNKRPPNYNCSTMTAAAYRFASNDSIMLAPNSQFQWIDTKNIALVPFSQAEPGDIFFEHTDNDRGNPVGHVGLIVDVNGGEQAIWHACSASSCQSNGNIGIGYSGLDHVQMWMTVENPARANDPAERGKYKWTTNRNEAYVGRVIGGDAPAPSPEPSKSVKPDAVITDKPRQSKAARKTVVAGRR